MQASQAALMSMKDANHLHERTRNITLACMVAPVEGRALTEE